MGTKTLDIVSTRLAVMALKATGKKDVNVEKLKAFPVALV